MAIKFKHSGVAYTADTPEEAARFISLLRKQDAEEEKTKALDRASQRMGRQISSQSLVSPANILLVFGTPWDEAKFESFIERLGQPQIQLLTALAESGRLTDEALRTQLGVKTNQALAGVLSGISKQAASLGIPARDVFTVENLRSHGKRRNIYTVADKFLEIARSMSFPRN